MAQPGDSNYRHDPQTDLSDCYRRAAAKRSFLFQQLLKVLAPALLAISRTKVSGRQQLPASGPYIIVASHFSITDPFFIALAAGQPRLRFVGKSQLFTARWAWLFLIIGAFPIRRGHADRQAFDLCSQVLSQGQRLLIFPQGGVRRDLAPGSARWGAGLLAQENEVPVIPVLLVASRWRREVVFGPQLKIERQTDPSPADNQRCADQLLAAIAALQNNRG